MSLLVLLPALIVLYFAIFIVCSALVDCDLALWRKDHFGKPVNALHKKVVWITGASSGIGRALALELARHGVFLILSARRKELLKQVQTECIEESKGLLTDKDVLVLPMDMLQTEKHEQHFKYVLNHFGCLDILVNNAGRSQRASWESINIQVDRELFELDVFSVLNLSRIAVRYFLNKPQGRGHIVCTSSLAGFSPVPFSSSYVAAKHALNQYLTTLRVEHPLIVTTIFAPGPVATDFLQEAFTNEPGFKACQSVKNQKRMSAERCGHLFAVAIANKMRVAWCSLYPANFLFYISRVPAFASTLYKLMGRSVMNKIREGKL